MEKACLVLSDGSIRDTNLTDLPQFDDVYQGDKYLVVRHRNHLDIISANPLQINENIISIDFTTSSATVYGGVNGYSHLINGTWGMSAGDMNGDGMINLTDLTDIWKLQAGIKGYQRGDINFNEQVDNIDKNKYCIPNFNKVSAVMQ